jgi:hypothetical protein
MEDSGGTSYDITYSPHHFKRIMAIRSNTGTLIEYAYD